jgi:hypothetical protein
MKFIGISANSWNLEIVKELQVSLSLFSFPLFRKILYLLWKRLTDNRAAVASGDSLLKIRDCSPVDMLSSLTEMHEIAFRSLRYLGQLSHESSSIDTCCPATPLRNNGRWLLQINLTWFSCLTGAINFAIHSVYITTRDVWIPRYSAWISREMHKYSDWNAILISLAS